MPAPLYNLIPFYPFTTPQQRVSGVSIGLHRDHQAERVQIQPEIPQLGHDLRQIHSRSVVRWAGHFYGGCSCGWITRGCVTEREAELTPCEVEILLADCAQRRREMDAGNR